MGTSYFDHVFRGDVSFGKTLSAENIATNSQGKIVGKTNADAFGFVNAKNYGAVGDLLYTYNSSNPNIVSYTSGTDSTVPIQNALNAASALLTSVSNGFHGKALCYIPQGSYYVTATLNVPQNVILHCDGTLFNFKSGNEALILAANGSECRRLTVFANNKNGVQWGNSASNSAGSVINQLKIYAVNTASSRFALKLYGINFNLSQIYLEGGSIGLDAYGSRIFGSQIIVTKSRTGIVLNACEHCCFDYVFWDSVVDVACKIDDSSDCLIRGRSTVNSNAGATPMSKGVVIGGNSTINNTNLDIEYLAQSTGGILLDISRAVSCRFKLSATNSRSTDQSNVSNSSHWIADSNGAVRNHDISKNYQYNNGSPTEVNTGVIAFGANLSGLLDIDLNVDDTIVNLFSGTQVGTLIVTLPTGFLTYVNNANKTLSKSFTINLTGVGTADLNIPPDYTFYNFIACGSGAGSGSGRLGSATNMAAGGGGGSGPGGMAELSGLVSELLVSGAATLYKFTIGAKGTGGAPVTTANTDGNPGTSGGTTQIKRNIDSYAILSAPGGNPGQGGTMVAGAAGSAPVSTNITQTATSGTASSITGVPATPTTVPVSPGGGAGGGGISATNVPYNGGNQGIGGAIVGSYVNTNTGGAASTTGNAGNGADGQVKSIYGSTGGIGGAGGGASVGGNGGKGGKGERGAGAGGGGAARTGSSGAGNDGGSGFIIGVLWS